MMAFVVLAAARTGSGSLLIGLVVLYIIGKAGSVLK